MNQTFQQIIKCCAEKQPLMVEKLWNWCQINSGTTNLKGLQQMSDVLKQDFSSIADHIETINLPPFQTVDMAGNTVFQSVGDGLLIRKRPELKRRILLSGHMDTVYPANSQFQQLEPINESEIRGPGVADMKGGLIVIRHALEAFEMTDGAKNLGWDVYISPDEEIGSPASAAIYQQIAANYQAALVYEPAMSKSGTLAKNRKGSGKLTLIAEGRSAHAGRAFNEGRNAIVYLAEALTEIHQLNGLRDGVTINIGLVSGGEALNIVPEKAVAKLDIRIAIPDDELWVMQQLNAILNRLEKKDYTLRIAGNFARPVKKVDSATEKLFHKLQQIAAELNISIDWKDSGGCCDGNNLSALGLPVLDTLGVRGGNIHSHQEFIVTESLSERASLSALLIHDLAQGSLEELTS